MVRTIIRIAHLVDEHRQEQSYLEDRAMLPVPRIHDGILDTQRARLERHFVAEDVLTGKPYV